MLQGFYIFVIFICKRNVWNAMMKMKKGNPPALTRKKTAETRVESGNRNTWFPLKISRTWNIFIFVSLPIIILCYICRYFTALHILRLPWWHFLREIFQLMKYLGILYLIAVQELASRARLLTSFQTRLAREAGRTENLSNHNNRAESTNFQEQR